MGYNYYLLIQGKNGESWDGPWDDLYHKEFNGSYSAVDNHYFYSEKDSCSYTKDSDEWSRYTFSYEALTIDYDTYFSSVNYSRDYSDLKEYLRKTANNDKMSYQDIIDLKTYLDDFISEQNHASTSVTQGYLEELKEYYELCTDYKKHYDMVRIIYGFRP